MSLLTPSFHLPLICSLQLLQPVSSDMIGRPHSLCSLPAKLNIRLQSVIEISRVRQLPNGSFHSYGRLAVAAVLSLHAGPWQPIGAPISSGIAPAGSLLLRPPRLASKQFPWPETNDKAWWDVCLAYRGPLLIWQLGATFWDCQLKSSLGRAHPVAPWWEGRPSWKLNGHSQVDVSPSLHRSLQAYLWAAEIWGFHLGVCIVVVRDAVSLVVEDRWNDYHPHVWGHYQILTLIYL